MRLTRLFTAALLITACQKAETPEQAAARIAEESAAARAAIEARNIAFEAHFMAGYADSVAAFYTEDGEILPPNDKAVAGRANIQAMFASFLGSGTFVFDLTTTGVVANGAHAIERGTYTMSFTPPAGAPPEVKASADTGKYVAHWRNEGGTWLMAHDIWNSDLPVPQP